MNSSPYLAPSRVNNAPRVLIRAVKPEPLFSQRRRQALCIGFLLIWPAFYAARNASANPLEVVAVTPATMKVGKSTSMPLAPGAKWFVEEGIANARVEEQSGTLTVRGTSAGNLRMRVEKSDGTIDRYAFRFVAPTTVVNAPLVPPAPEASVAMTSAFVNSPYLAGIAPTTPISPATQQLMTRQALSQMAPPATPSDDPLANIPAIPANLGGTGTPLPPPTPLVTPTPAPAPVVTPNGLPLPSGNSGGGVLTSPADPTPTTPALPELPPVAGGVSATPKPAATRPTAPKPVTPRPTPKPTGGQVVRPLPPAPPANAGGRAETPARPPRISEPWPSASRGSNADVNYRTTPRLPNNVPVPAAKTGIQVTQGMARLVSFPDNILSVFFSDPAVMDARAINARTIAVTGIGAGNSTLAVFTSRYPGDAIGRPNIYRVATSGRAVTAQANAMLANPQAVETAIAEALGDPRIRTTVVKLPNGSLAARLTGTVRNTAEVQGAETTAAFFVDKALISSSLYADSTAPTIDAVLSGVDIAPPNPQNVLQDSLRQLTGNQTIELVSLPGGLALKAQTDSPAEAEAILRVLPTINQPVLPFIVLRGQSTPQDPYYSSQALQGEDRVLTQRLQAVTGITTVTAVRAATNSVAIYGTVANRGEYEAVKRYGTILGQAAQGTLRPTGIEGSLPAYDPAGGYLRTLGVQMFVRILDPAEATVRNVTVETNVVEISRTALRNLGAQFGSSSLTNETITYSPVTGANGTPVIGTDGLPLQTRNVTRTVSPSFNSGSITAGNGFAGFGGLGIIDPFRVQLNALAQKGDARILASPNVRAVEGMPAQITIGGERPVPSAVATTGATAQSVEFRRYGVIISMRPTVSDDNTIMLQIRADITQPDRTFEINLNGALIPGETVRSIDTSLAVRPGDIIVMGGLLTNEKRVQTSRVPVLGSLPVIGSLFTSKRYENNETELAIFMSPRIESLPATQNTKAIVERGPAFPLLPSRQEANGILFQNTTRAPG